MSADGLNAPGGDVPLAATVLVCTRGRPRLVADAVASVLAAPQLPRELLIVDQSAAPDAALASIGTVRGCRVRYRHASATGISRARNEGLRAAAHRDVVLLDDDMLVEACWLAPLLAGRRAAGEGGSATGRVLPAPPEGDGGSVPPSALIERDSPATFRGRQDADVVPGAGVVLDRDAVLALGGYDERLGPGTRWPAAEDNDLGLRLLDAGYEVRHVPDAVFLHRAWRSKPEVLRLRWGYARGKGAFYAKHMRRAGPYVRRRLTAELRRRGGRAARALPRAPRAAAAELVSIAGLLSGFAGWTLRERVIRAAAPR